MAFYIEYFDGNTYTGVQLTKFASNLYNDGVVSGFSAAAHSPNNLSVDVAIGAAIKGGYQIYTDGATNVPIGSNTSGYNRIDILALSYDSVNKLATIVDVQGTPSSSPTPPTLLSNQHALAQVAVGNNVSVINSGNITDVRTYATPTTLPLFTITVPAAGWSGGANTVNVPGVTATSKLIIGIAETASANARTAARSGYIYATAQGAGTVTFTCDGTTPAVDIPFNILIAG